MTKNKTVAEFITERIEKIDKSQKDIAEEADFPKANLITMIKQGKTRVPIDRVPKLARALEVEPAELMKMVLSEYSPEILKAIESTLGEIVVKPKK